MAAGGGPVRAGRHDGDAGVCFDRDPAAGQARSEPAEALCGERADVVGQVHAGRLVAIGQRHDLVDPVATAHHQITADGAQRGTQVGQGIQQVGQPVRVGVSGAQHVVIEHEHRHDRRARPDGRIERRQVTQPQVPGEDDERGAHSPRYVPKLQMFPSGSRTLKPSEP